MTRLIRYTQEHPGVILPTAFAFVAGVVVGLAQAAQVGGP